MYLVFLNPVTYQNEDEVDQSIAGVVDLRIQPKLKIGYWLIPSLYASKKSTQRPERVCLYVCRDNYFIKQFDRLWDKAGELISARDRYRSQ